MSSGQPAVPGVNYVGGRAYLIVAVHCSAEWQKKEWGRCWEGVVAMGVAVP